jgi:hypothetical protein
MAETCVFKRPAYISAIGTACAQSIERGEGHAVGCLAFVPPVAEVPEESPAQLLAQTFISEAEQLQRQRDQREREVVASENQAAALGRIAEHFEKKDRAAEKSRAEAWDRMKDLPIEVDTEEIRCIFCEAKSRRVTRGGLLILGCVSCFSRALGR